jgi:diguanylate cyclase (GGDEF)-like protein
LLTRLVETRLVARAAIACLTLGLFALAGLSMWSTASTQRATAHVRALNETTDTWGQVFRQVNVEEDAMHDLLNEGTDLGDELLASTIGSAEASLVGLERNRDPAVAYQARQVHEAYNGYTEILRELLAAARRGDREAAEQQSLQATVLCTSLRKLTAVNIENKRLESAEYLAAVDNESRQVRAAAAVAFGFDFILLLACAAVLLSYQRRVERHAARSRHQALHDSLTGLGNRIMLGDRCALALRNAKRNEELVGLLLIDLNRFKEVNDTLGHHCGDQLLQQVAVHLLDAVREVDTVARLGGDEFAILLPGIASAEEAALIAKRVLIALSRPVDVGGLPLEVSGSIGVAVYPDHSDDVEQLLQHADIAMYAAKRGQLGVAVYEPSLNDFDPGQLTVLAELRHAMENAEIVLHYQPKVHNDTGRICGVEALARWQHPRRGLLEPAEFIPLAERNGLIEPLTDYVLAAALAQCRRWLDEDMQLPVAVNVGASCLLDPNFPAQIANLLACEQVPAEMLTLELTESAIITDPPRALAVLSRIRELGVRLSIDDFGTGYSSMAYLQTMPVHELKIDRCFISRIQTEGSSTAIVRAVLDLARNLNLQVVAEGVESYETWQMLGALGCDVSQGYYFSKPLPAADVMAAVTTR